MTPSPAGPMGVLLRKAAALLALLTLGTLVVTLERGAFGVDPRLVLVTRLLLIPLGVTIVGIGLGKTWGRWLGLAGGIAVLPWAFVLTFGLPRGAPMQQQALALAASLVLITSLSGRTMFEHFEGRAARDWRGRRMGVVRWTLILNLASILSLFLFVGVYRYAIQWHIAIPGLLLVGLVSGVGLLARQKTVGLLLVALSCILFVPAGGYFVWAEARHTGEMYLFAAAFLPGVVAGWVCLVTFAGPLWRLCSMDERTPSRGSTPNAALKESLRGVRAVTFDFFGTLAAHRTGRGRGRELVEYLQARGLACEAWEHAVLYDAFAAHGLEYDPGSPAEEQRRYRIRLAERVFRRLGVRAPPEAAAEHADAIWSLLGPASLSVYPDAAPTLRRLREAGYPLAVVSNWQAGLGHFCAELGLGEAFQHVIASAELRFAKPDPRIFTEAAGRLGVRPEQVLHVGDSRTEDVDAARSAGLRALLLCRDPGPNDLDVAWISTLAAVPELLAKRTTGGPA